MFVNYKPTKSLRAVQDASSKAHQAVGYGEVWVEVQCSSGETKISAHRARAAHTDVRREHPVRDVGAVGRVRLLGSPLVARESKNPSVRPRRQDQRRD